MLERNLENASIDNVIKICNALDLTVDSLESDAEDYVSKSHSLRRIPIIGRIACGEPIDAHENIEGYRYEAANRLPSGEIFSLIAEGNSMLPKIPDKSFVLIRKQSEVENGEIAAVRFVHTGEVTLKRVKRQNELLILVPDNPEYEPIVVTNDNPVEIVGKAFQISVDL